MRNKLIGLFIFISFGICNAQYTDYIGAGHADGITVTTSSNYLEAVGENTINGKGMDAKRFEASRFLAQATFGADLGEIDVLAETLDFEAWIDNQFSQPQTNYLTSMEAVWAELLQLYEEYNYDSDDIFGPWAVHWNYTWWQNMMDEPDQLRQRMALALSEIMVISTNSDIRDWANGMSSYYDVLMDHSFGNYEDLMQDVSLHIMMGYYLSHLNNSKEIPAENIFPDENYAREIMQLFSIGLYELNNDGSRKLDIDGNEIPTYDNNDIQEMAKVFTGLYPGGIEPWVDWVDEPYHGLGIWGADKTLPMLMDENFHDTGEKIIFDGALTLPAGQSGMVDIEQAINFLFNHDNVGPFVALRLIQRFVKSNPSPEYIDRVATVFNDDGNGVRGDMKAVIKAVLLDEEARSCAGLEMENSGRLREPTMKYAQVARAIETYTPTGRYWNNGFGYFDDTKHHPLMSPTVFNFYLPDHSPVGELADNGIVAPEFKLHNTQTATSYINAVNAWTIWNGLMWDWEWWDDPNIPNGDSDDPNHPNQDPNNQGPVLDTDYFEVLADDPETMINEYDIIFTHGQLSDEMRTIIRESITPLQWGDVNWDRARLGLYLLMISPDYNIVK